MIIFLIGIIFILIVIMSMSKIFIEKITLPKEALLKEIEELKQRVDKLENEQK